MKDIDFDELDKAVSSVLGQQTQKTDEQTTASSAVAAPAPTDDTAPDASVTASADTNEASSSPEAETPHEEPISLESEVLGSAAIPQADSTPASAATEEHVATTTVDNTVSVDDTSAEAATADDTTAPTADSPAVRRGKFMDVMHPSADMNPGAENSMVAPPARKTITPLNPDVKPEERSDISGADEKADPLSNTVADIEATAIPNAPDPADTAMTAEAEVPQEPELVADTPKPDESIVQPNDTANEPDDSVAEETEAMAADAPAAPEAAEASVSPETPFIPGVAVDKRPLGQPETAASEGAPLDENTQAIGPEADVTTPVAEPAPRELQADIVQTENTHENEDTDATVPSGSMMTLTDDLAETAAPADVQPENPDSTPVSTAPAAPPAENPLFDTKTYNQPLADTAAGQKQPKKWLWWVVGLVGCLAVGGGIGAVFFYLGF